MVMRWMPWNKQNPCCLVPRCGGGRSFIGGDDVFFDLERSWLLVVGCWLLVVGCWLLVVGCWLLVVGCRL